MKRLVAAALLAACPVSTVGAQTAPYPPITIPLKLDQVPGKAVWYSTGNPGIPGKDNESRSA